MIWAKKVEIKAMVCANTGQNHKNKPPGNSKTGCSDIFEVYKIISRVAAIVTGFFCVRLFASLIVKAVENVQYSYPTYAR